jgi:hypothetical protein
MSRYKYDAFVSYRHKEPTQSWVRDLLVPNLEAEGCTICIDYRDFRLGALLIPEMARAVEISRYTLAILTPLYLKSNFTELENIMAEQLGLENSQRRLILIMRKKCILPINLRTLFWLDMTTESNSSNNINQLADELRKTNLRF